MGATQAQGVDSTAKYLLADRYHRVNFTIPNGPWRLDDFNILGELMHIGREKAIELLNDMHEVFFESLAPCFERFLNIPQFRVSLVSYSPFISHNLLKAELFATTSFGGVG
jgi:hypothetical protein